METILLFACMAFLFLTVVFTIAACFFCYRYVTDKDSEPHRVIFCCAASLICNAITFVLRMAIL